MARNLSSSLGSSYVTASVQQVTNLGQTRGVLRAAGLILEREVKLMLSRPGRGKEYPRGKKVHRASAPGEPPAVDTGALRYSTNGRWAERDTYRVSSNMEYGSVLEYGNARIAPRPFMRPALKAALPKMRKVLGSIGAQLKTSVLGRG